MDNVGGTGSTNGNGGGNTSSGGGVGSSGGGGGGGGGGGAGGGNGTNGNGNSGGNNGSGSGNGTNSASPPAPTVPRLPLNSGFNSMYPSIPQPIATMADSYRCVSLFCCSIALLLFVFFLSCVPYFFTFFFENKLAYNY